MLTELEQSRYKSDMDSPERKKLYKTYDLKDINKAMNDHWHKVDMGLTPEYVQFQNSEVINSAQVIDEDIKT